MHKFIVYKSWERFTGLSFITIIIIIIIYFSYIFIKSTNSNISQKEYCKYRTICKKKKKTYKYKILLKKNWKKLKKIDKIDKIIWFWLQIYKTFV
jgi:hypothetical protein